METGALNCVVAFIRPFQLDAVVDALRHARNPGGGKIFVGPVVLARRIRAGAWGEAEVSRSRLRERRAPRRAGRG